MSANDLKRTLAVIRINWSTVVHCHSSRVASSAVAAMIARARNPVQVAIEKAAEVTKIQSLPKVGTLHPSRPPTEDI